MNIHSGPGSDSLMHAEQYLITHITVLKSPHICYFTLGHMLLLGNDENILGQAFLPLKNTIYCIVVF